VSNTIGQNFQIFQTEAQKASQDAVLRKGEGEANGPEDIRKVAEEFESLFLGLVLKSMRDTVMKSGLVDGGNAEDIYRSMLDTEYAKIMASQRHTGIADNIEMFMKGETKVNADVGPAGIKAYRQVETATALPTRAKRETMAEGLKTAPSNSLKAP
jgi:Rod binding domain-containing protein